MSQMSTGLSDCESSPRRILGPRWDGRDTFTVEEAAGILGLSRWAGYEAARSGELPTIRIRRRLIVPRVALERLLGGGA